MCIYCNFNGKNEIVLGEGTYADLCKSQFLLKLYTKDDDYWIGMYAERCKTKLGRKILYCPFCGRKLDE